MIRGYVGGANVNLGTKGAQHVHFFFGLLVAHGANQPVAFNHGSEGKAHSSIARGAFDNSTARLEAAVGLGVFNHLNGHTVLGRVAWVKVFYLGKYFARNSLGDCVEAHHGGAANRF